MKKIYSLLLVAFVVLSGVAARAQSTLVYSEAFTSGATPTTQCTAWTAYCASLVSANTYTGFKISGSLNTTGISCTNPTVAAAVATALRTATTYTGSSDGFTWRVGTGCGSGCGGPIVELTATSGTCACNTGYTIRPAINNLNWGGITTTSCGAPSQTMTVTFYYTPPPACTTPTAQPTGLSFTPSLFAINGSFTAASPAADNYLVVMTTSSVAPTAPTDGVTYTAGTNALGGKILSAGTATSFSATGLSDNTPYWFWVYAYNSTSCTGGPTYRTTSPLTSTASTTACALSGTKTVGPTGDYPTIAAAVTAINSVGMGGSLALELQSGYTGESYPITIGQLTCAGASRRLTIRPQTTMTVTASVANTMIDLNGADFVTLDGRVGSTGTTKALTFTNTSTSSAAATVTFLNDATNNIVRYMTLRGASASTSGGVVRFRTTTGTTGNDNNKIEYCDILDAVGFPPPYNCIYSSGTSGKENSNDTIADCNIANFYHTSSQSCGIMVGNANSDWTISNNRIYQTASRNYTSSQSIYGIFVSNTSGNNFTIEDNTIGYSSSAGTGTFTMTGSSGEYFFGIYFYGGTSGVSNIQGNTVTNINFGSTFGSLYGIYIGTGSVNVGTTSPNIIGAATGTGAIVCNITSNGTTGVYGIYAGAASPAVVNIHNNIIGGINLVGSSTSVGVGFRGIYCFSNAATTVQGNTIGSTSTANSISCQPATTSTGNQNVYGISIDLNNSTSTDPVISGNTVANITANGAGSSAQMYGIAFSNTARANITGNMIRDLSTRSVYTTLSSAIGLAGIAYIGNSAAPVISQNTINALINANTSSVQSNVAGILITSASNASVSRNRIYDIRNASTYTSTTFPPTAIGIFSYAPATSLDINNNMITLGVSQNTNTAFVGIMQGGTSSGAIHKVYFNTVVVSGAASSGSIASLCLLRGNYSGSSYTTPFDIKNNILTNIRNGGTGKHYAIGNNINGTSSASGWAAGACDYNVLRTQNSATIGYWSGDRTFTAWRSAAAGDVNSFSSLVAVVNTAVGNLHVNMDTVANDAESHGIYIAGYDKDYDNDDRPGPMGSVNGGGFGVDIGADEFDGVPNDNIPPVIVYTNATCGDNGDRVFTANIADPGGVPTTGGNVPRVYFRKGAAAYSSSPGVLTAGTALNGTWSFTVSATTMGGLTTGNTVNYYVLAQDNGGSVGSNTNTGLVATNVNTVSTHPSNPSTYSVGLSGTYTVGSGGNYTTITSAASAYNAYCLNGPVTFSLISSTYPSESFPITIGNNATASATNTLTIKPAAGVAATVNGPASTNAIFKLLNARYVTLDGVNSGGSSLTLNSTYTSTFANVWLASTSGTGPGCRNITIKNLNIVGGSNTTTVSYGILAGMDNGSTPTTSSGMDNDTITIQDNTITKVYYGIYANGTSSTSSGGLNAWNITGNTFGPSSYSATTNIGLRAMSLVNMVSPAITENVIQNVGITTLSNQAAGIYLVGSVSSPSIIENTITGITSNYSGTSTLANVGIYLGSNVLNAQVLKNNISNIANIYPSLGGAAQGIMVSTGSTASNTLIANNFISDIRSYSYTSIPYAPIGISLEGTNGNVKMYYNTILLNSSFAGYSTSTYSACINIAGSPSFIDLRNNILVNNFNNTNSGTDKGWAIYTTAANTAFSEMDYNNYYVSAPNVLAYLSGDRTTLSAIQSFYGRNANCINMSPTFVSTTDLHLQSVVGNSALAAGTPVSVTEDFDGDTRSGSTPVMGADETTFSACSSITAGTVSAAAPAMCGSGTTTVTATGATTGETMQWRSSTDGSTWTTIAGATNASYVIPSAISVTTQYRFVNKCSSSALADSATVTVTINPIPASITGTLNVCIGATTTLASATSGGTWSSSNGNVTIGSTTGVVTGVSAGTSVITYTITATGCYTTAIVTANALPSVGGGSGATICEGNNATLTASGASNYSWSPATGLSATTGASVTASPTATVTYTVTGTNAAGCSANATVTVSVNPVPGTVTASGAGTFCNSTTITASGGSGGTIYFQGTTSGGTSTATPSTSEVVTSSGTYYFRARTAAGCWGTESSVAVTINPNAGSVTASGGGTFCGSTTITASGGSGGTIYFQGTTSGGTSTATPSSSEVVTASGTYYFRARTAAGCWGPEGSVSVTINPLPGATTVSGAGTFCGSTNLTASGGSGGTIYFQFGTSGGTSTLAPFNSASVFVSGTFYFRAQTALGCWGPEGSATVTINPNAGAVTASGGGTFCNSTTITAAGGSGGTIYFQGTTSGGTSTTTPSSSEVVTASGTYYFRARTAAGCWGPEGSVNVTINPLPAAVTVTGGDTYCTSSAALTASGGSGGTIYYQGTTSGGTSTTTSSSTESVSSTGTYYFRARTALGCWGTEGSASVVFNSLPTVASITPSGTNLCDGNSLTLTAGSVTGTGSLVSYNWSGPGSYSSTTSANAVTFAAATTNSGNFSVTVTYPGVGCTSNAVATSTAVTVNANPAAVSGADYFCAAATAAYTNPTPGGVWSSSNTSVATIGSTSGTATGVAAGTSVLTYTIGGLCFSTKQITVNALPTVSSTGDEICVGGTGTVTATPSAGNVRWFDAPTAGTLLHTGATMTVTPTVTANYYAEAFTSVSDSLTSTFAAGNGQNGAMFNLNVLNSVNLNSFTISSASAGSITYEIYYRSGSFSGFETTSGAWTLLTTFPSHFSATAGSRVLTLPAPLAVTGGQTYAFYITGTSGTLNYTNAGSVGTVYSSNSDMQIMSGVGKVYPFGGTFSPRMLNFTVGYSIPGCTSASRSVSTVTVNPVPSVATLAATPNPVCQGSALTLSATGVSGTGTATSYSWTGPASYSTTTTGATQTYTVPATTASGNYSVVVTFPGSGCVSAPTASSFVNVSPNPVAYNVTGGGTICSGDAGVHIGLDWSITGINYQLYNGSTATGSPVAGSTSALDFGLITTAGTYTVRATNASTGCVNDMIGSVAVNVNPLPATFAVTGGGTACEGTGGVAVGLANSVSGINYQLYNGASAVGSPVAGTGAAISFGNQTVSGTYTVLATNTTTSCSVAMTGSAVVVINPAPTAYTLTGSGSYCSGGSGLAIGLANSQSGISYQLYSGASTVGSAVAGTGSAISFGTYTAAGTYTVLATNTSTTCTGAMTGSSSVSIDPLPAVYSVTGGGAYCAGGTGITVGLSNSTSGINYQLYNGATAIGSPVAGTNAAISFGSQTLAGTYTVVATNATTGCVSNMTGSAVVVMNALPVAQTVTGGGSFCAGGAGVAVGLSGSQTDVTYQLYNGASTISTPIVGTGSAVSFGSQASAGTYTVVGTNSVTGCVNNMSGSATVVVNPLPAQYVVSGGGNYCAGGSGVEITLNGSNTGMSYQLYNGASVSGSPVAGTNAAISFGTRTATGTYTAIATNTVTGCTSNMLSSAAVIIDPLPAALAVTGGGSYCAGGAGQAIGLASSASGINYQLYNGASAVGSNVAGTGVAISFGTQTASGTYTVLATNSITSCTNAMSGSATIIINPLPTVQTVTGGGTYCQYGSGVAVGLASSQSGINYTLYNGATVMGSAVAGTGSAISFGNQTLAGTYTVVGTNATTSCTNAMSGNAVVVMNPAPTAYAVTGGGPYCAGGVGVYVGVANSQTGIVYQLYRGATAVGSPVSGTGSAISFGLQTVAGAYSVLATNTSTSCTNSMSGSATIVVNPLPNAYSTFGGGSYCAGDAGVAVGLSSTQTGVSYQLYNTGTATGAAISGTGYSISFGLQTAAGTYSILATNTSTGCQNVMFGSSVVVVNPLPVVYSVTGGGNYCAGGSGVIVGLSSSESGVNYTTYNGASAYSTVGGVGSAIDFGYVYAAGTYTVLATNYMTGCTSAMSGSATVGVNTPPSAFTVTGGGSYCAGGSGVAVGLASSSSSATYTLYNGTTALGTPVSGTGSAISFGNQTAAGTYTVRATSTTNGCTTGMTGSATVSVNAAPTAFTVTGGGAYCAGSTGANISLTGSNTGVTYQLYVGTTPVGGPVTGTGGTLSLGTYTTIGTYSAVATVTLTGCTGNMAGSAAVTTYTLPTVYNVTGGGSYCSGGLGVAVGLSGSESGITYQLYNGASPVASISGTGAAISFGPQFSAGSYSVRATSTSTSCVNGMAGLATVSINPLPSVFVATGGGTLCAGGSGLGITLSGSQTGVNYQLFNGASAVTGGFVPGSGSAISFGTYATAGVYTVLATDPVTGCSNSMAGTPQIIVNPLPLSYTVTGGGSFCAGGAGVAVGLSGSNTGITYRLYNGSTLVGAAVAGSGGAITFGVQTSAGSYSVRATNNSTGCVAGMTGSANVVVNSLPVAFTVTGGGAYCTGGAGMPVGLAWSASGVNYRLYKDGVAVGGDIAGINGALTFGTFTSVGVYSVAAVSAAGCAQNMSGTATISINPLPSDQTVTGTGGYCAGTAGLNVTLSGSEAGVDYTLYSGGLPTTYTAAGTGSAIDFGPVTAGTYSVVAVNSTTLCSRTLSGTAAISINALPVTYAVSGGGAYCSDASGVNIGLAGSQSGVSYTLYNGASAIGTPVAGTGSTISFGMQTTVGTYSVMATNAATGCSAAMSGTAAVSVNSAPTVQTVIGGGSYCAGGTGANIGLSSSQGGVIYQLYNGASATGTPINGTGSAISFGPQTAVGNYSVVAVNSSTGCTTPMSGSVTVSSNPLPVVQTVAGGGAYCSGGTGSEIMLTSSVAGTSYMLYRGAIAVSSALAGTGGSLSFGPQTVAGAYTVLATNTATGCTRAMSGTAVVSVNAAPAVQSVTGGGAYCAGGAGSIVGLSGSQIGVNYTLSNGTATPVTISGTGGSLTFGSMLSAGIYTVTATDASTSCTSTMAGAATVSVNSLPLEYNVTGGGGYCTGGSGVVIGLDGSQTGVNYQLFIGAASTGLTVSGTGADINFGAQTAAGIYSVLATDATTGCVRGMSVTTSVAVNPAPVVFNMNGGGNYCAGGSGVFVGLDGSEFGVNYRLYKDGVATATSVSGTGIDITFGLQTATGMYTVVAENSMTSCTASMSGSAVVGINAAPAAFVVSAGGGYCQGTSGLNISLSGSETGVLYRLYSGSVPLPILVAGTGGSIDFGMMPAGTYSVLATSTIGSCSAPMTSTANVVLNTLPAAYSVTGSAGYCDGGSGVAVGLSGSEVNVSYQLYNGASMSGSAVTGTGAAISFGNRVAGNYSVVATNLTTGCVRNMTGNAAVVLNAQPNVYTVTGGGSICSGAAGVNISLSGSQSGISYRLYRGATQVGSAVAGTGVSITFAGVNTSGTYTVLATNNTTSCAVGMSGASTVVVNPVPSSFSMTGGGNYCPGTAGVAVGLGGSETGVSYQLYVGSSSVGSPVAGTGSAIDFGTQTISGSYNVIATNTATSCTANMTGTASVSVNTQPGAYALTAGASAYCAGGAGVVYNLAGSQTGVSYQLFVNGIASGAPVAGTGSPLSFGLRTTAGIYSAVATSAANGCTTVMTGTPSLAVNTLPASFTVTGGGSYCAGSAGSEVALIGSESGVTYQAMAGTTLVGAAVAGTGAGVSLGFLPAGTYSVRATNTVTGCRTNMHGTATVAENAAPVAYTVTGGGQFCSGGTGVAVGLANSAVGITYRLYKDAVATTTTVAGTGSAITFGNQTSAGNYSVVAVNGVTGCTGAMSGSVSVSVNPTPAAQTVTGGGQFCSGGTGIAVGLANSAIGVNYRLYNGATPVGASVAGTGGSISFGAQAVAGTYTVLATGTTGGCSRAMTGNAVVVVNPLPASFSVTGGGNYCEGTSGVAIGLSGSSADVSYKLYHGSSVVATASGTGSSLSFGSVTTPGIYSVVASVSATGCSRTMSGTASVAMTATVVPTLALNVASGDTICAGTPAVFTSTASNEGLTPAYSWTVNGVSVSATTSGFSYVPTNGDVVSLTLNSSAACAVPATVSATRTLTVLENQLPSVTATISGDTLCSGNPVTITATAVYGGTAPTFTWIRNGVPAATGNVFTFVPSAGDAIYVRMASNYACRLSSMVSSSVDTMDVILPQSPIVGIIAAQGTTVAAGEALTLSATVTNVYAPTYQWYVNGAVVHGATTSIFTYNKYADNDSVTIKVTNNTPCGPYSSTNGLRVNVTTVGVAAVNAAEFDVRLMPNPTSGSFFIKGSVTGVASGVVSVDVTDMLGQTVYTGSAQVRSGVVDQRVQLDGALANGMYMVTLRTDGTSKVFHLMLQQ